MVSSIQSLLQPVPDRATLAANTRRIRLRDSLDLEDLTRWLALHRYHATGAVELPGEFSWRGGILDVYAHDWLAPVRIELFGDQVESLRQFDVASQRSLATLGQVEITVQAAHARDAQGCLTDYLPAQTGVAVGRARPDPGGGPSFSGAVRGAAELLSPGWTHAAGHSFRLCFRCGAGDGRGGRRAAIADRIGRTLQRRNRTGARGTGPGRPRGTRSFWWAKPRRKSSGWARS